MLIVGLGGIIGTMLRVLISSIAGGFALWIVNGVGSFVLGYLNGRIPGESKRKLFIGTGMLGSFTTFSAFSEEWFQLLNLNLPIGIIYGLGMTVLCFVLCWAGLKLGMVWREQA